MAALRRDLGRQLAVRRKAAGYLQRELGVLVGYSRTAIASAETGGTKVGLQLWQRADQVLQTGEPFTRGYERIRAQIAAEARADAERIVAEACPAEKERLASGLESRTVSQARQGYAQHRDVWPGDGETWAEVVEETLRWDAPIGNFMAQAHQSGCVPNESAQRPGGVESSRCAMSWAAWSGSLSVLVSRSICWRASKLGACT